MIIKITKLSSFLLNTIGESIVALRGLFLNDVARYASLSDARCKNIKFPRKIVVESGTTCSYLAMLI